MKTISTILIATLFLFSCDDSGGSHNPIDEPNDLAADTTYVKAEVIDSAEFSHKKYMDSMRVVNDMLHDRTIKFIEYMGKHKIWMLKRKPCRYSI